MKTLRLILILLGAVTVAGVAYAATGPFGRNYKQDYFSGDSHTSLNWVFTPQPGANYEGLGPGCAALPPAHCVMDEAKFIQNYHDRLYDNRSQVDSGRAAAEIDIMLGQPGPEFSPPGTTEAQDIQNGIDYAKNHYTKWVDLINIYAHGLVPGYSVNWNDYMHFCGAGDPTCPIPDTNGMGVRDHNGNVELCTAAVNCIGDVSFFDDFNDDGMDYAVNFNANGKHFIVKHKCGNMTGDLVALVIPSSRMVVRKVSSHPAPQPLGTTMTYNINVSELANIPLDHVTVTDTLPAQFHYDGPAAAPAPTHVVGRTLTWIFQSPADNAILATIAAGAGENLSVKVTSVGIGNGIVNTASATSVDEFGGTLTPGSGSTTNTVEPVSTPIVIGRNGDIHAGCGAGPGGYVEGFASAGDTDDYVISATGAVTNFASNGGNNLLTLGASGGYHDVCATDLYAAANADYTDPTYATNPPLPANTAATPYDIAGWSGVYYVNGDAYIRASAPITHKMTIVSRGGNINIESDILLANTVQTPSQVQSIGMIASGDINIWPSATSVMAYLFADGAIYTCDLSVGSCQTPTLNVYGFLMASAIHFNRMGPVNAIGSPVGEQVVLNPQIYLNPPTFFDQATVDGPQLIGQGERPPLF